MSMKNNKSKVRSKDQLVKSILIIVVLWLIGSMALSLVSNFMIRTITISSENREKVYESYGFVDSEAYLVNSPYTGEATPLIPEGQRVRKNEAVFKVVGSEGTAMQSQAEKVMYAPLAGMVSYLVDGYETYETMEQIGALDLEQVYKTLEKTVRNNHVQEGMPYAKIVNNFDQIYLYIPCKINDYTADLNVDEVITVRLMDIDAELYGTIVDSTKVVLGQPDEDAEPEEGTVKQTDPKEEINAADPALDATQGEFMIKVDLGPVNQAVLSRRVFMVQLPYNVKQDITLPANAVVYKDDVPGVYCVSKGFVVWQRINIVEQMDRQIIVDNLAEGTKVITSPRLVKEGEKITVRN